MPLQDRQPLTPADYPSFPAKHKPEIIDAEFDAIAKVQRGIAAKHREARKLLKLSAWGSMTQHFHASQNARKKRNFNTRRLSASAKRRK